MTAISGTTALNLGIAAVAIYLIVLWVALAFFVFRDARRRSESWIFAGLATLLGLIPPFLGALIYLVIRPPRTLDETRALMLEEEALREPEPEGPLRRPCPTCGREIEEDFIICPYCRTQFARRCTGCERPLRLGWAVCPYCATEVGSHSLSRAGR
ncbi:MAG TPA: zinc ribbon domain-containing protein [Dehalococcoidia bacterium]|nr:zinc ribbon domain-containing protein [Dehalococcoidia bacterium]